MSVVHGKPDELIFNVCATNNVFIGNWELVIKTVTLAVCEDISQSTFSLSCNAVKSFFTHDVSNSSYSQHETPLAIIGVNAKRGELLTSNVSSFKFRITHPVEQIKFTLTDVAKKCEVQKNVICTIFFNIYRVS